MEFLDFEILSHFEDKWCPNKSSQQKLLELFSIAEISAVENFPVARLRQRGNESTIPGEQLFFTGRDIH